MGDDARMTCLLGWRLSTTDDDDDDDDDDECA